jgi:hypothetical protein
MFSSDTDKIALFLMFLVLVLLGTYVSVIVIQALLVALWGIEQTKIQIFVAMLIIKALSWN